MEVCDVCRKTLEKEEYTISVRKGTYYNRWECCSEKCLGVAVEKEKIKIPVTTAYQEIIEGEQVQTAEKLKKSKKNEKTKFDYASKRDDIKYYCNNTQYHHSGYHDNAVKTAMPILTKIATILTVKEAIDIFLEKDESFTALSASSLASLARSSEDLAIS